MEEITRHLSHQLIERGHKVVVVVNRFPAELPREEEWEGIEIRRFSFLYPSRKTASPATFWHMFEGVAAYRHFINQWQPHLIHLICAGPNSLYTWLALAGKYLPLLVTMQGELFMDKHRIYERSVFARWALQRLLDRANAVTACSAYVLQDACRQFRIKSRVTKVVFNGVDLREADGESLSDGDQPTSMAPDTRYILAAGRVVTNKGFDVLVRAFSCLAAEFPDTHLAIAGDGDALGSLKELVAALGLNDRVHFLGRCDRRQLVSLYRDCYFFVLPSPVEPFGIVCLEAMRAGKAVIATNIGGPPEFLEHERQALLVEPNCAQALACAMRKLLKDRELCAAMGESARTRVRSFGWGEITDQYLEIYRQLLI